jgi:nucleotide-binding universal stress UspA family protein
MLRMDDTQGRIILALDGSPLAQAAAMVAIQIAHSQKWAIQGLYVVDEVLILEPYANYRAELSSVESLAGRQEVLATFEAHGNLALQWLEEACRAAGLPLADELVVGGVTEMVLQRAKGVTLLALGRRGKGHAATPTHLGSHFRAIAHHASCPLLVGGDVQRALQRLLLAYNGSGRAQQALIWAGRLQRSLAAEVTVLAVQEDDNVDLAQSWLEEVQAHLPPAGLQHCRFLKRKGQPAAEIVAVAAEKQADLILMGGYRHRTALLEWLSGSTVNRVLRATPLPILIA